MPTRHPPLTYLGLEDLGDSVRVRAALPDGQVRETELVKDFKAHIPDLGAEQREAVLRRNFDFRGPRSLLFRMEGGIGDSVTAFEVILRLQQLLEQRGSGEFERIGVFNPVAFRFYQRFLEVLPVFHRFADEAVTTPKFPVRVLEAAPHGVRVDHLSIGSAWERLWALWGLPGPYLAPDLSRGRPALRHALAAEFARLRDESPGLPDAGSYVLLCPNARFQGHLKAWPAAYWQELLGRILAETRWQIVVIVDSARDSFVRPQPRVQIYDRHEKQPPNDFLKLSALIGHAAAMVSVDTGTALSAGLLATPCVTLFGPTAPIYFGHANNANLRISVCPPCMDGPRSRLCTKNVCLFELEPGDVFEILLRVAGRPAPGEAPRTS